MSYIKKFNEEFETDFEHDKSFAEWCLCNKDYKFDCNDKFWFDSKTLERKSWNDIIKIYYEENNEGK